MAGHDAMIVSSGKDQEKGLPSWLRGIASANFCSSCKTHPLPDRNFYCTDCTVAFCKECEQQHVLSGHRTIKAYKARNEMSFRTEDLKELCDISDVQKYTFNSHYIVLINKKGAGVARSQDHSDGAGCKSCQYQFKSPSPGVKCCSLECKVEAVMKNFQGRSMKNEAETTVETISEGSVSNVQSLRKRPRKQKHPRRAPLY